MKLRLSPLQPSQPSADESVGIKKTSESTETQATKAARNEKGPRHPAMAVALWGCMIADCRIATALELKYNVLSQPAVKTSA